MKFPFLPTNKHEMSLKGWDCVDIIIISGDAYVDHPSFGPALIGRYLESFGYKVGIIPQPVWRSDEDFMALGSPKLFFGITSGNMDSMISNYTSEKKPRKKDDYSENGIQGKRPDRAVIVYSNMIRKLFPKIPIIIGGIEASLRRQSHYDYWSNKIRRSILLDSRADLLVYGMAEKAILETAQRIKKQNALTGISGTAYVSSSLPNQDALRLPSYEELTKNKDALITSTKATVVEYSSKNPRAIIEPCQNRYIIIEPPSSLSHSELDNLYTLPFTRKAHPRYLGPIPAYSFVKHSVTSHRGCYGGCSFCTLGLHQGKYITSRSQESIIWEIENIISRQYDFTGTILDVGGPSANMWGSYCSKKENCKRVSCLVPSICPNLKVDHNKQLKMLRKIKNLNFIKNVFINSGIRYDLALSSPDYIKKITQNNVCGQLSLAPEHTSSKVLKLMGKRNFSRYLKFLEIFKTANTQAGKKQFVIPYFIASHPGSSLHNMYELSLYLRKNHLRLQQVQNFIPIPMTLSTAMYYAQVDPSTLKSIYVAKGEARYLQSALLQPYLKRNKPYLKKALKLLGKEKELAHLSQDFKKSS